MALTSVVTVAQMVPAAALSPALVGALERLPRGTAPALSHGAVTLATLLTAVALLMSAPVPVVRPLHYAVLPRLARGPDELVASNSLSSLGEGLAFFAGPVIAGLGVQSVGPGMVFVGATVAGAMATVLCLHLDTGRSTVRSAEVAAGWRVAFEGVSTLWRNWAVLVVLLVLTTRFVIGGAIDVLGVSFAQSVLDIGESGARLVIGALGIGGMVGALVAGSAAMRDRLAPVVAVNGILQGVAFAMVALVTALTPAVAALALCGFGGAIMLVAGRTVLQLTVEDRVLAKVFAVQEAVALLGVALGAAIAPALVQRWGPADAFIPLGLGLGVVVVAGYFFVRQLDARAVLVTKEIELLRRVGFLSALPPYELERLARSAAWVDVDAGTDVVRQSDLGDLFYVIGEGDFTVIIDGAARPGLLGPGEGLGELALLRSTRRNATITAATDGRLLVIAGEDFLAAVTGGTDGRAVAEEVSQAHLERDRRHGG